MKIRVITPFAKGFYKPEGEAAVHFNLGKGEIMDVPIERATELVGGGCFEPVGWKIEVEKPKKEKKKKEIKPVKLFIEELEKLPKIGKKTAADIVKIYPDIDSLKQGIKEDKLPWDEDVEEILKKKYGGKK